VGQVVFVYLAKIVLETKRKYCLLSKWLILESLELLMELQLMFLNENVLVKNLNVKRNIVNVIAQDLNVRLIVIV
jgi:hypothetical protein